MSKKIDTSFMKEINSSDDWTNSVLKNEGQLVVVDVFQTQWGPCGMLAAHFSNLYFDLAEKRGLCFARANADSCKPLAEFSGTNTSMPNFLFYLNGERVAAVKGPKMPEILKLVDEKAPFL